MRGRGWCGGLGLAVVLAAARPAAGVEIEDDHDLRLELRGAPGCVLLPDEARDLDVCASIGVDVAAFLASAPPEDPVSRVVALVVWAPSPGARAAMTVTASPPLAATPEGVADTLAGFYNSQLPAGEQIHRRDDPRLSWTATTAGGTPAIQFVAEKGAVPADRFALGYSIYGAKHAYLVAFVAASSAEAFTRKMAADIMAGLSVLPLSGEERRQASRALAEGPNRKRAGCGIHF